MAYAPVELRHVPLKRSLFGYHRGAVDAVLDDIAASYETVWYMCTRIRTAVKDDQFFQLMREVEADETWIGGKNGNRRSPRGFNGEIKNRCTNDHTIKRRSARSARGGGRF